MNNNTIGKCFHKNMLFIAIFLAVSCTSPDIRPYIQSQLDDVDHFIADSDYDSALKILSQLQNKKRLSTDESNLIFSYVIRAASLKRNISEEELGEQMLDAIRSQSDDQIAESIRRVTGKDEPPATPENNYQLIAKTAPQYPADAHENKIEGYVVVAFTVTKHGSVEDLVVVESDPPGVFEETTIQTVSQFKYIPKLVNGEPVDTPGVRYLIRFKLSEQEYPE